MNTLRLLISPDWPQQHRDCAWTLCAEHGEILQQGRSEPRHWPGVQPAQTPAQGQAAPPLACELILAGHQVNAFTVQLPKGAAGQRPEVIAAACEELLLDDPADCQFTLPPLAPGNTPASERPAMAVISRQRLAALTASLGELGLEPRGAWPLGFLLPVDSATGQRLAWAEDGQLTLGHPDGSFLTLALDQDLAAWPAQLGRLGYSLPLTVIDRENDPAGCAQLAQAYAAGWLQRSAVASPALPAAPPGGLLNGALAPPRPGRDLFGQLRRPLGLTAALFGLAGALLLLDGGRLAWQARGYRQSIESQYRQAFPQGVLVDPPRQMQRQLDLLRQNAGQLGGQDLLTLLAPLAGIGGPLSGQRLDYDGRRLQVVATLADAELTSLQARARQLGLNLQIDQRVRQGSQLTATFTLSAELSR